MKIKTCFCLFDIGLYTLNAKLSYEEFAKKCKESRKYEKWFYYQHDIWLASCVDCTFITLQSIGFNQRILEFAHDSCDCSPTCLSNLLILIRTIIFLMNSVLIVGKVFSWKI